MPQEALMLLEQKEDEFGFLPEFKLIKDQIVGNIQQVKAKNYFDSLEELLEKNDYESVIKSLSENRALYGMYSNVSSI